MMILRSCSAEILIIFEFWSISAAFRCDLFNYELELAFYIDVYTLLDLIVLWWFWCRTCKNQLRFRISMIIENSKLSRTKQFELNIIVSNQIILEWDWFFNLIKQVILWAELLWWRYSGLHVIKRQELSSMKGLNIHTSLSDGTLFHKRN